MSATNIARAWAITRADRLVLGFTDHDRVLTFDGQEFRPESGLSARAIIQGAGLSVDNSEAEGALTDDAITEADLMAGRWDGAELRMWEVDWTNTSSRRLAFRGHLGEVSRANGAFRAELRGLSEPLNAATGRVFHPRCAARLGDAQCGIALDNPNFYAETVVEMLEEGRLFRFAAFEAYDSAWFEGGEMIVTSGAAEGLRGRIKNDRALPGGGREIELWEGLGLQPASGDGLRLVVGCDRRAETCRLKFRNYLNFRGFPHLPPEDWLLAPGSVGRND